MVFHNFAELKASLGQQKRRTAAVVCAHDETTLKAVEQCRDQVDAVLIGDGKKIRALTDLPCEIIPEEDMLTAAYKGVELIREGRADFLVKGKLDTSLILKAVVNKEHGLRTGRLMSHLAFLELPGYDRLVVLTDSGMVIRPTLDQKKEILLNAVETLRRMGYEEPMVGLLAAVEKVNPQMPETLDAAELTRLNREGELPGCYVEGPLSYDILMSPESAEKKGYASRIVGNADILMVGDMATGNILGKALTVTAKGRMAGIIVGAGAPVALTSRGSKLEEKVNSILLAAAGCR